MSLSGLSGLSGLFGGSAAVPLPLDLGVSFLGAWGMYPLSAAATNLFTLRRVSDSAEQTFARLANNPDTASINSFIGASTATIKSLVDQTGTGNDAAQTTTNAQPAYVTHLGKSAAYFISSGANKFWNLPSAPTLTGRNFTIYNVFCVDDQTYSAVTVFPYGVPVLGASSAGPYQSGDTRTTAHLMELQWGGFPNSTIAMIGGNCSININVIRSNSSKTRFRINELVNDSNTLADTSSKALIFLGKQGSFVNAGARLIATLVAPAHSDAEIAQVISSLQSLMGTSAKTKLVAFDGDSITGGYKESVSLDVRDESWPYQMMSAINDQAVMATNRAISSSQLVDGTGDANKDLTAWAAKKIDAQLNAAYAKKILVVMAGLNDISIINAAGAGLTTYNRLVTYCQARKAAGWLKIIVCTVFPYKGFVTAGIDAERTDYNSRIAANGLTDWDAVVDTASLNWQPGGSSDWSTNYQGASGTHPNAAGRTLIVNAVQPVLAAML